jgi:hypothetical protein
MGKGKSASGKTYTSKGERRSSIGYRDAPDQRMLNKIRALNKGKDVVFTMANPNKNETNRPFIKVKMDGKLHLKRQQYSHKMPVETDV